MVSLDKSVLNLSLRFVPQGEAKRTVPLGENV